MQPLPLEKCIVSRFRSKLMCLLLSSVQVKMEEYEKELLELNDNTDRLLRTYAELTEMQMVLEKAAGFFDKKTKLGDMPMESSYDRSFGIDTDGPLLEGGVSSSSSSSGAECIRVIGVSGRRSRDSALLKSLPHCVVAFAAWRSVLCRLQRRLPRLASLQGPLSRRRSTALSACCSVRHEATCCCAQRPSTLCETRQRVRCRRRACSLSFSLERGLAPRL